MKTSEEWALYYAIYSDTWPGMLAEVLKSMTARDVMGFSQTVTRLDKACSGDLARRREEASMFNPPPGLGGDTN